METRKNGTMTSDLANMPRKYFLASIRMPGKKIPLGRNKPCYCGSGKKFKKCHLNAVYHKKSIVGKFGQWLKRLFN